MHGRSTRSLGVMGISSEVLFWWMAASLVLLNAVVTYRVVRSPLERWRKCIAIAGVWFVPVLGALLVAIGIGRAPLAPNSIGQSGVPSDVGS